MSEQQGEGTHIPGEENLSAQGAVLSTEERAAAVGWHEKDGGLSAEEFIAKRDDHNGLLRNDVKKLEKQLAENQETMNSMAEFLQKNRAEALKQGYDKAIADAAAEMQQAVDDSDGDAFTRAAQKKDQLTERKGKVDEETIIKAKPAADPLQQAFHDHKAAHPEIFDTSVKAQLWEQELRYQATNNPSLTFDQAAAAADKVVRETHFQQRSHLGPVDGETSSGAVSDFAQLPAEAKKAYEMFKRGNPEFTKESYLQSYNEA